MNEKIKYLLSVVGGVLAAMTKQYGVILLFVIIGIVFDFVTGMIKSKVTGIPLSSRRGFVGFWKKVSLLAALFFGVFLDYFIPSVLDEIAAVQLPFGLPFGLIIGAYIVINECISICENLYACNPSIMPKWVRKLIENAKEKIEEGEK